MVVLSQTPRSSQGGLVSHFSSEPSRDLGFRQAREGAPNPRWGIQAQAPAARVAARSHSQMAGAALGKLRSFFRFRIVLRSRVLQELKRITWPCHNPVLSLLLP